MAVEWFEDDQCGIYQEKPLDGAPDLGWLYLPSAV